jgi:sarcosine oxidase subunit beta
MATEGRPRRNYAVIILGSGLMGSTLAHVLAREGERDLLLYDINTPAAGASGRGAGILCAQCWDPWDIRVVEETREEYRREFSDNPGVGFTVNGGLRTVRSSRCEELLRRRQRELRDAGIEAHLVGPEEIRDRWFPSGNFQDVRRGLHTPGDAVVSPPALVFGYAEKAQRLGVDVEWGFGIEEVSFDGGEWTLQTRYARSQAPKLVLACGAWTGRVLRDLGHPLPFAPYRTQACRLRPPRRADPFPSLHDTEEDVYVRPAPGGELIAGNGTELRETDPDRANLGGDLPFLWHIGQFFQDRLGDWFGSSLESAWAGVCVSTPDRHPLVGPVPGASGLFVAAGFNGFGVMRAGGIARRMASGILQGDWGSLAPCDPARFRGAVEPFPPRPGFTLEANP